MTSSNISGSVAMRLLVALVAVCCDASTSNAQDRLVGDWRGYWSRAGDSMRIVALGLAFGGAAGNLVDRFRSPQGVIDFIDIGLGEVRFWTFNLADSAVTVGALVLAWSLSREERESAAAKAAAERAVAHPVDASPGVSGTRE